MLNAKIISRILKKQKQNLFFFFFKEKISLILIEEDSCIGNTSRFIDKRSSTLSRRQLE